MEVEGRGVFKVGEIGQWVGMAASIVGLILELIAKADYGYVVLTGGSLVWSIATKVKYYRATKESRNAARYRLR